MVNLSVPHVPNSDNKLAEREGLPERDFKIAEED